MAAIAPNQLVVTGKEFKDKYPNERIIILGCTTNHGYNWKKPMLSSKAGLSICSRGESADVFRELIISDDVTIIIGENEIVLSHMTLSEPKKISSDHELMKSFVKTNPKSIINFDKEAITDEICRIASLADGTYYVRNLGIVRQHLGIYGM